MWMARRRPWVMPWLRMGNHRGKAIVTSHPTNVGATPSRLHLCHRPHIATRRVFTRTEHHVDTRWAVLNPHVRWMACQRPTIMPQLQSIDVGSFRADTQSAPTAFRADTQVRPYGFSGEHTGPHPPRVLGSCSFVLGRTHRSAPTAFRANTRFAPTAFRANTQVRTLHGFSVLVPLFSGEHTGSHPTRVLGSWLVLGEHKVRPYGSRFLFLCSRANTRFAPTGLGSWLVLGEHKVRPYGSRFLFLCSWANTRFAPSTGSWYSDS